MKTIYDQYGELAMKSNEEIEMLRWEKKLCKVGGFILGYFVGAAVVLILTY